MTPSTLAPTSLRKRIAAFALYLFMAGGCYALVCAPAILIAERLGRSQSFFHITQLVATVLCFPAAVFFLWLTRGLRYNWKRCFALVACVLSGLWLVFILYVLLSFDLSGMD